jgi:hypothetical protein
MPINQTHILKLHSVQLVRVISFSAFTSPYTRFIVILFIPVTCVWH